MRSHENEAFVLSRNTTAVMVPSGDQIELQAGLSGFITQALGGSFTLYVEGNLYRLAGENADAIGKQVLQPPELPPGATDDDIKALAWKQMRTCYDPEIPIDIVELGLVYECEVSANEQGGRNVAVKMTLTAPGWTSSRWMLPMNASPMPTCAMASRSRVMPSFEMLSLIQYQ